MEEKRLNRLVDDCIKIEEIRKAFEQGERQEVMTESRKHKSHSLGLSSLCCSASSGNTFYLLMLLSFKLPCPQNFFFFEVLEFITTFRSIKPLRFRLCPSKSALQYWSSLLQDKHNFRNLSVKLFV